MVVRGTDENGVTVVWSEMNKRWEYSDGKAYYPGQKEECSKCGKPRLDLNGVKDCDFCLQGLTVCDFITACCCGHGCDENAYITLADGRRFVLDKMNW